MKALQVTGFVVVVMLSAAVWAGGQPVGALALDERRGDQWGWAVDYETSGAAQQRALSECGEGCSVVLTFARCAAYAADQDSASTAVGWAESFGSAAEARQRALSECSSRGGSSSCLVRAWGCNSPVVEDGLGLDRAARQEVQRGLQSAGFEPGGADGMFGPRTRTAIRSWQTSRGARATGYLDAAAVTSLRPSIAGQPTFREREPAIAATSTPAAPPTTSAAQQQPPPTSAEQENLFWQSIVNSTDPADYEAYLEVFPNGLFRRLAENRLASLRSPAVAAPASAGRPSVGGVGPTSSGARVSGVGGASLGGAAVDAPRRAGDVFRDCADCPEMVVLAGGGLAMGRYEVTVGEYRAFASATGGGAGDGCISVRGDSWRDPGFPQTDGHPVTCVSWDDAQEYVSWLSRTTGAPYRLPTESEWARAASGSPEGVGCGTRGFDEGTCPVGSHGANPAGLSDMLGNVREWTSDCWEGDCSLRVVRGGSWHVNAEDLRPGARFWSSAGDRDFLQGFRVSRTLD